MPDVLTLTRLPPAVHQAVASRYALAEAVDAAARAAVFAEPHALSGVQAVITNGGVGVRADEIAVLPSLKVISTIGVGSEAVDHAAAQARGITVTDGRGTLEEGVADHAMALLLALLRDIPAFDRALRHGGPRPTRTPAAVAGKRLGVLGLGDIGRRIARRAEVFSLSVGYHNRKPRSDAPYAYHTSPLALAEASDILLVATPGGAQTRSLVDERVIAALGPSGYLVNIGRGSVVDTAALVEALRRGVIAGAALDVFEGEPDPPAWLASAPNLILTPHQAANSPERVVAMTRRLLESLGAHVQGPQIHGVTQ